MFFAPIALLLDVADIKKEPFSRFCRFGMADLVEVLPLDLCQHPVFTSLQISNELVSKS